MRRIGEPWLDRPYRHRRGVYAVIAGARGLLLVEQEGELQLPGGGIEAGESPFRALHREVHEETGWRIGALRRLGAFRRYTWMEEYGFWAHKVQSIYLARAVCRLGPPLEAGHTPLWLPPRQAARQLDVEGDREMVRRAIAARLV